MTYKVDGRFVVLTTDGRTTAAERQAVFDSIRSDPRVPIGACLIIDIRKYAIQLTQEQLDDRVRSLLEGLRDKLGVACAVVVGDGSLRVGLGLQLIAGDWNFRVGVFRTETSARSWLASYATRHQRRD